MIVQASELRTQLVGYIDGMMRTSTAGYLGAVTSAQGFPALCTALSKLALAVLRHHFDNAATVSFLQRLFAGFISRACDEDQSGEIGAFECPFPDLWILAFSQATEQVAA